MEAKDVIVAQSIAYAELMQDRDNLREELLKLRVENEKRDAEKAPEGE